MSQDYYQIFSSSLGEVQNTYQIKCLWWFWHNKIFWCTQYKTLNLRVELADDQNIARSKLNHTTLNSFFHISISSIRHLKYTFQIYPHKNKHSCFIPSIFPSRYIMLMALGNMKFIPSKCKISMFFIQVLQLWIDIFSKWLSHVWKFFETLTWILSTINRITKHEIIYCNWAEKSLTVLSLK